MKKNISMILCLVMALTSVILLPAKETVRADTGYSDVITSGYTYTIKNVKGHLPLAVCGGSSIAGENVILAADTSGLSFDGDTSQKFIPETVLYGDGIHSVYRLKTAGNSNLVVSADPAGTLNAVTAQRQTGTETQDFMIAPIATGSDRFVIRLYSNKNQAATNLYLCISNVFAYQTGGSAANTGVSGNTSFGNVFLRRYDSEAAALADLTCQWYFDWNLSSSANYSGLYRIQNRTTGRYLSVRQKAESHSATVYTELYNESTYEQI